MSSPHAIAVIGMACKFPGADSLEEYWDVLDAGQSMVSLPPSGRFPDHSHGRSTPKSVFFGNYLSDIASFDNQFFKKSSREAASMDPAQRLLLEVAYQALESSGYFGPREQDPDVGCFVGVCASDYNDNVASHPPNAYSTLGTLRAFLTGRISHTFGLTGPSVTFDTACSSSAVAIDAACKAILHGDCTSALAGGASIFTSPHFFQSLAAASFLSPTGACKPFDAAADGYCRGEGVGLVMLKRLSQAIADGDHIMGTILATSVTQSSNLVPITVPYSPTQTALYRKVIRLAGTDPNHVTYLEAHGTGTQVGDVQEFQSIKEAFGHGARELPLHFASVKGNIGHTEGASGVAGLIKVLLMMRKRQIPKQANHEHPNPKISLVPGQLVIPTETIPWEAPLLTACVNNYGAAGSMAAMVVQEYPTGYTEPLESRPTQKYPIFVSANSPNALFENCQKLKQFISSSRLTKTEPNLLADLAYGLSDKQNTSLPYVLAITASSIEDLVGQLEKVTVDSASLCNRSEPKPKPVVLVFSGQNPRCASISKEVYESSAILRKYLDDCEATLKDLGYEGIFPQIFSTDPIDDVVAQQARQFAVQYATAQSWIACGLKVDYVLGHSFGQLVGLAVSGILSLADGLKLACGRGVLMRDKWGPERGTMIALDADLDTTNELITTVRATTPSCGIEFACYNGPKSHVLVGSDAEIETVAKAAKELSIRHKVMDMTHGFHSRFCDDILPGLEQLAQGLTYNPPRIPMETCSTGESWSSPTAKLIADHTRTPVYFEEAVKRIEARHGACTWLEAGSNSSIINITRRVFADTDRAAHLLCPVNLSQDGATSQLAEATATLWRYRHLTQFWPFHRTQRQQYKQLLLPPYQFERRRHWLDFNLGVEKGGAYHQDDAALPKVVDPDPVFFTFSGFQDNDQRQSSFTIDPRAIEWQTLLKGHAVLDEPLCPAPLYMELVLRASRELATLLNISCAQMPRLDALEISKPLGTAQDKMVTLVLKQSRDTPHKFSFEFQSQARRSGDGAGAAQPTVHATGRLEMIPLDDSKHLEAELNRLGKLMRHQKLDSLTSSPDCEAVQGSLVYKVFSRVVSYHDFYKGVRSISSRDGMAVATVCLPEAQPSVVQDMLSNPVAIDNFLQVPGLQSNCLSPCPSDHVFVCTLVERMQFSSDFPKFRGNVWEVLSMSTATTDKEVSSDVVVRDQATGKVLFAAFGAIFSKVRTSTLARVISRANKTGSDLNAITPAQHNGISKTQVKEVVMVEEINVPVLPQAAPSQATTAVPPTKSHVANLDVQLRQMLEKLTDIPSNEFQEHVQLQDLGIDSLMATEIVSEIKEVFDITIPQDQLQYMTTFASLRDYLSTKLGTNVISGEVVAKSTHLAPPAPITPNTQAKPPHVQVTQVQKSDANDELVLRLAGLLGDHLECPATSFQRSTNLTDCGLDSLLCMELMSDIEKLFGVSVDLSALNMESNFGDLADLLVQAVTGGLPVHSASNSTSPASRGAMIPTPYSERSQDLESSNMSPVLTTAPLDFETVKADFGDLAVEYGFANFYKNVSSQQDQLVLAYTVEAFFDLGIDLGRLESGDPIPQLNALPKHKHLCNALYEVLRAGGVADYDGKGYVRSDKALDPARSSALLADLVKRFPQHAQEHNLLDLCGAELARVLRGDRDPLAVLFGSKASRALLEDVYSTSPMYIVMSRLLTSFLERALGKSLPGVDGKFRILELGAGTGSTTKHVVERLTQCGIPIEYTFTDLSASLVGAAKRKFSKYSCMKYMTIDIEKEPPAELLGQFDVVLSTNCIHATSNLPNSVSNINKLLRPHGFVSLVEFTKRFFWFDIVFGMLDGWWLFDDGRPYVLATPEFWEKSMLDSGFGHVSWTGGSTPESEAVRVITGFKQPVADPSLCRSIPQERTSTIETLVYGHTDKKLPLRADVHYPSPAQAAKHKVWTPALMIHGGGHVMLSRKDVRPRQTQLLLDNGVLPISVDYRLCPETTIVEGPLADVNRAYAWVLQTLPSLRLRPHASAAAATASSTLQIDGGRAVVVGWSTGGTLAMSLGWTAAPRGLRAPDAVLAFYCPTDYEDAFWRGPNVPDRSEPFRNEPYDPADGLFPAPVTGYNPPPAATGALGRAGGGWMAPTDARSRLVLHMNWRGQTLPVLFGGFQAAARAQREGGGNNAKALMQLEQPAVEEIVQASPYAQIVRGHYTAPTHIVFGTSDDLIPLAQVQRTADALREAGVESGLTLVPGEPHLFDIYPDRDGTRWNAVLEGYRFVLNRLGKELSEK